MTITITWAGLKVFAGYVGAALLGAVIVVAVVLWLLRDFNPMGR